MIYSLTEIETETEINIISLTKTETKTEMFCETETTYKRNSEHMKRNSNWNEIQNENGYIKYLKN